MKYYNDQPSIYCMNRDWRFRETDISDLPASRRHDDVYDYSKAAGAKGPAEISYDDSEWETAELPHDWVVQKEFTPDAMLNHGYKMRGNGWYRKKFRLGEEDMGKQILLEFEGLSSKASIYINGLLCKRQFYGYNSFSVDISDFVCFYPAVNQLVVKIEADAWEGWWYEGAGIYRNVWLIKKPPVHIDYQGVYVKPKEQNDGTWKLEIETTIENSFGTGAGFRLETALYQSGKKVLDLPKKRADINGFDHVLCRQETVFEDVKKWSTEDPSLYEICVKCISLSETGEEVSEEDGLDYLKVSFGFRTIRLDAETGFWLNGENIKLKGFCCHQDHAGVGVAVPYAVKEFRISQLKKLGANAYRCAHNPDPEILQICDKLGMMVMEENRTFASHPEVLEEVRGIVRNARNHPSVILYSIFNEEPLQGTHRGMHMAERIRNTIHKMDHTRPVLGSFNGGYLEDEGAVHALDAVGINYNPMRYDEFHEKYPNIPLIASETASAFMVRGEYRTDEEHNTIGSYDDFCAPWGNTHRDAWKWINERKFVAGTFVWTGFDYRGEPTPFEWPSVGTFFGTYDSCGFPKEACELYKVMWKKEPGIHMITDWNSSRKVGELQKVIVAANCQEIELSVNDRVLERRKTTAYAQDEFYVPFEKGTLKAVGFIEGTEAASHCLAVPGEIYRLKAACSKEALMNDGLDSVIVNVIAVDAEGMEVPDADNLVHFDVKGGAKVIGVGNGNPNSHEPDYAAQRKLFHGRAQAILRNSGSDNAVVEVWTDGIGRTVVEIPVHQGQRIPYMESVSDVVTVGWSMYYRLLDEMPDVDMEINENDRNSFEPMEFHGRPQNVFTGKLLKYGIYYNQIKTSRDGKRRFLYFPDVRGQVFVWLNGIKAAERTDKTTGELKIMIPNGEDTLYKCFVIIRNENTESNEAGICAPVMLVDCLGE